MIFLWQASGSRYLFKNVSISELEGRRKVTCHVFRWGCLVKLTEAQNPEPHEGRHTGHSNLVTAFSCTPFPVPLNALGSVSTLCQVHVTTGHKHRRHCLHHCFASGSFEDGGTFKVPILRRRPVLLVWSTWATESHKPVVPTLIMHIKQHTGITMQHKAVEVIGLLNCCFCLRDWGPLFPVSLNPRIPMAEENAHPDPCTLYTQ